MANTRVGLYKRVQVEGEMRFLPVSRDDKGRFIEDTVRFNEQDVKREDGSYYVRYRDGKRQVSLCLRGYNFATAVRFHEVKEAELKASAAGVNVVSITLSPAPQAQAQPEQAPAPETKAQKVDKNRSVILTNHVYSGHFVTLW